ncbi:MAG: phosphoribosyltransferase [Ilumatobacteraceae bacterium]
MRRRAYQDRHEAGTELADLVAIHLAGHLAGTDRSPNTVDVDVVVLGLARGGVPVAAPIAVRLGAPLDVLTVRKIGAPGQRELAIGAVASGGLIMFNDDLVARLGLRRREIDDLAARARAELVEKEARFRRDHPAVPLAGRVVVVVDDGLATGATMQVALAAVRTAEPASMVAAIPVGAPDSCRRVAESADVLICPFQPEDFSAVGQWYRDFSATSDDEVLRLLAG